MRVSFDEYEVIIRQYNERGPFEEDIASTSLLSTVLDECVEYEAEYFSISFVKGEDVIKKIGLITEQSTLMPQIFFPPGSNRVLIGFNKQVNIFDTEGFKQVGELKLGSIFYQFYSTSKKQLVVAFHELGVVGLSLQGEELWNYHSDVVEHISITDDEIGFSSMDGIQHKIPI